MRLIKTNSGTLVNADHIVTIEFADDRTGTKPCVFVTMVNGKGYYMPPSIRNDDDFSRMVANAWRPK